MLFEGLNTPSPDPILGMAARFNADPGPDKVDMGIGVYMDDQGRSPVLETVKRAEAILQREQSSKVYLSSAGHDGYNHHIRTLLLGADHPALTDGRAQTIQTPGGTGALRVAADFLQALKGPCRVWIPDPTWANHRGLFASAGHEVATYRYLDAATGGVAYSAMMDDLSQLGAGDVVILHGCCQNPTGADLTAAQWSEVSDLLSARGAVALIDIAYQGFGQGLDEDAAGLRLLARTQPEMLIASSCSKNFALYRERVGALTLVSKSAGSADKALGHLLPVVRSNYSMPPDHGAAVVAQILGDAELRALWVEEVTQMRERLIEVRRALAGAMNQTGGRDYGFIARNRGMFVQLDLTPEQVDYLREHEHIHLSRSGRMNVAGLNSRNVARVGAAVGRILNGATHG